MLVLGIMLACQALAVLAGMMILDRSIHRVLDEVKAQRIQQENLIRVLGWSDDNLKTRVAGAGTTKLDLDPPHRRAGR